MQFKHILFLTCLLQISTLALHAQKKLLTNDSQNHWGGADDGKISNDGKYVFYTWSANGTGGSVLMATDRSWSKAFMGYNAAFTNDSRFVYYELGLDTLVKFDLTKKTSEYTLHVNVGSFNMSPSSKYQFFVYRSGKEVVLHNMVSGKETRYPDVLEYRFDPAGDAVLLHTKETISWIDLPGLETKIINRVPKVSDTKLSYKFDNSGSAMAITISNKKGVNLYYYKTGMDSARLLVASHPEGTKAGTKLSENGQFMYPSPVFTPDGRSLMFRMKEVPEDIQKDTSVITDKVDVWNYKDANLQSEQLQSNASDWDPYGWLFNPFITGIIPVTGGKWTPLDDNKTVVYKLGNKYALERATVNNPEAYWNKSQAEVTYLVSLNDGRRTVITNNKVPVHQIELTLSPNEKFLTWGDPDSNNLMCYEIATGITRNMSEKMPVPVMHNPPGVVSDRAFNVANWLQDYSRVFVEDEFDIWELDPLGQAAPVNITNGYGRAHHIKFQLAKHESVFGDVKSLLLPNQQLILIAQDQETMYDGFFKVKLGSSADPVKCDLGPYNYYENGFGGEPLKAKNAEVYLLKRMSASDAPNYFISKNLESFARISNVQPQKDYNWMTSEVIHYPMPDGRMGTAILYKPENFDPNKKYPLIFHYYQRRSVEAYNYLAPDLSHGDLSIPWYVSNGYLVCIPDIINDKPGYIAETVINSVVSAAKYLCKNPWADSTKMGVQGHSLGGYETDVLLSRTNIFAAAQPSSGFSDLFSYYGGLAYSGISLMNYLEVAKPQLTMGGTIWEKPELYREASPLLHLDKVTTPVLLEAGKTDGSDADGGGVPFSQSVEIFTALRRLQKPVWLLEYDIGHIIGDPDMQLDFTIRQQQFFDHYLKGKPAPLWMTEGIDAKYKGLKSGLQLDTSGKQP